MNCSIVATHNSRMLHDTARQFRSKQARFAVLAALLVCVVPSCSVFHDNFRPVEKNAFYRSAQMDGATLDATINRYDIRTVINLRGAHPDEKWYRREVAACKKHGIDHEDLRLTMGAVPTPESLLQLVEWLENKPKPILVHCQAGIHRAGTASAVYELLQGKGPDEARKQFGMFFFDAPIGELLNLYDGKKPFAQWVREDYPGVYAAHVATKTADSR